MIAASNVEPVRPAVTMKYLWRLLSSGKTRSPRSAVIQARLRARHNLASHSEVLSQENMGSETIGPISVPATAREAPLEHAPLSPHFCRTYYAFERRRGRMCKELNSAKRTQLDPLGLDAAPSIKNEIERGNFKAWH